MKIGIASDHRGFKRKEALRKYLEKKAFEVVNYGTDSLERVDYPEFAFKIGEAASRKDIDLGILICGTGIGMSIACNKVNGALCAKIDNVKEAFYAKNHNNANVIALGASMSIIKMKDIMDTFLKTKFITDDERYQYRINLINEYKNK